MQKRPHLSTPHTNHYYGVPDNGNELANAIRSFWEVRERLSVSDKIILMDDRLAIANNLRKNILRTLHSAHQGVSSMKSTANAAVYWPGINNDIRNVQYTCYFYIILIGD